MFSAGLSVLLLNIWFTLTLLLEDISCFPGGLFNLRWLLCTRVSPKVYCTGGCSVYPLCIYSMLKKVKFIFKTCAFFEQSAVIKYWKGPVWRLTGQRTCVFVYALVQKEKLMTALKAKRWTNERQEMGKFFKGIGNKLYNMLQLSVQELFEFSSSRPVRPSNGHTGLRNKRKVMF